jgi:hypothetical protein
MDHEEAVRLRAADRYLLRELAGDEQNSFEEHYFSCIDCAQEVKAGEHLRASLRAVLSERRAKVAASAANPGWWAWLFGRPAMAASWAMAGLLLVLSGYQGLVVVPGLNTRLAEANAPQAYQSFALRSLTRGEDQPITLARTQHFAGLRVDPDPRYTFPKYRGEIRNQSGARVLSIVTPSPLRAGDPLEFLVPSTSIPAGSYELVVHGLDEAQPGRETEIATCRFVVTR